MSSPSTRLLRSLRFACLGASLTLASSGCSRCSDEPRVPFKLNPQPESADLTVHAPDAAAPNAQSYETAVDRLSSDGQTLAVTHVRASLELDLDGDGDRDLVLLREDDAHKLQLLVAQREPSAFASLVAVAGFVEQDLTSCRVTAPRFSALSSTKAALSFGLACTDAVTGLPVGPYSSLWLFSLEARPRVYERIDVIAADAQGQPALTLSPHSLDADGDGHDDVGLTVTGAGAVEPDALELVYLDRPSGLLRDAREPEATLSAWAAAAQSQLSKQTDQAIARAELALSLQRAVCRELGSPLLALSGSPGVPCGSMKSTGALLVTLVSGHSKRGDLRAAFDAYRSLRRTEPKPAERELEKVSAALLKLPAQSGVTLRRGPSVEAVRAPRLHLPSARFVGEDTLYVHRLSPVLFDLASNEESAAPSSSDQLLRDPSGQLIATGIERTCEGQTVRIERAPPRGSDYTVNAPVASAVLAPSPVAPGCNRNAARPDDGGFTVLGWAPQGLLAARGSELRLVPLGSDGHASGPARTLAPDAPRPAPLPSGSATADAARYVEATPYGVLVYGPSSTHVELWRPEGYAEIAKGPLEAAISPSARKVALAASGSVWLLERAN